MICSTIAEKQPGVAVAGALARLRLDGVEPDDARQVGAPRPVLEDRPHGEPAAGVAGQHHRTDPRSGRQASERPHLRQRVERVGPRVDPPELAVVRAPRRALRQHDRELRAARAAELLLDPVEVGVDVARRRLLVAGVLPVEVDEDVDRLRRVEAGREQDERAGDGREAFDRNAPDAAERPLGLVRDGDPRARPAPDAL
jgi:hypothetical protein